MNVKKPATNVPNKFNLWLNWIFKELPTVKENLPLLLNKSENTVSGWQYAGKCPHLDTIAAMAVILNISIDDMVNNNQNVSLDKIKRSIKRAKRNLTKNQIS